MFHLFDHPFLILALSLLTFWFSAWIGSWLRQRRGTIKEDAHDDFSFVLGGTLTLLGLIVGFTFSMAVSRYDQRKNCEEEEANAIGTEYVRADLLPVDQASRVRALLKSYLDQRMLAYTTRDEQLQEESNIQTARLQTEMWTVVTASASADPTPVKALVLAGMNDVLNSQGYTQAAWWNRIPTAAWALLIMIAIFCNIMIGFGAHGRSAFLFLVLPVALSISLFLISDIDSPHNGVIRVQPQNLESVAASLHLQ
jgi:lipopolysaccharide export LptBFGC system permease protein LptF